MKLGYIVESIINIERNMKNDFLNLVTYISEFILFDYR